MALTCDLADIGPDQDFEAGARVGAPKADGHCGVHSDVSHIARGESQPPDGLLPVDVVSGRGYGSTRRTAREFRVVCKK